MMEGKPVFVFGSFSEDEALSYQKSSPDPASAGQKPSSAKPRAPAACSSPKPASSPALEPPKLPAKLPVPEPEVQPQANGHGLGHQVKPDVGTSLLVPEVQEKPVSTETAVTRKVELEGSTGNKIFVPRGLVNSGNTCFLNSTLQALLSCSLFWDLLQSLRSQNISQDHFPVLHAFASFAAEFEGTQSSESTPKKDVEVGKPLTPTMFDPLLRRFNPQQPTGVGASRNRQEDAQEFLSFLMNHMHEELLKFEGGEQVPETSVDDEDGWETVGRRNRTTLTRTYNVKESPLYDIFGGRQQSIVKARGLKASALVEPFYLLHLDILPEAVRSVEDALKLYAAPETLEGYKSAATGRAQDASKSVKIWSLPKVLILHLMRFSFGARGTGKLHKPIRFSLHLTLGRELLASPSGPTASESRKYELMATITHHGQDSSSGHYTADARQSDGSWLRFDDKVVKPAGWKSVLHDQAYLLFYRQETRGK